MNKTGLIIKREYFSRVKKKSFLIMTILGPLLMAGLMIVPIFLAQMDDGKERTIRVLDETGLFYQKFTNSETLKFVYITEALNVAKEDIKVSEDYALLYIAKTQVALPTRAVLYSDVQPGINITSYIKRTMAKEIEQQKLILNIDQLDLNEEDRELAMNIPESIKTSINLSTIKLSEEGEEKTSTEVMMAVGIFAGILIYFFIFMFGVQVMRGVIEEKVNRIIEVIVSSVKPFQLMLGKIVGIALVGLTQFLLWIVLTFAIVSVFQFVYADKLPAAPSHTLVGQSQLIPANPAETVPPDQITEIFEAIFSINFGVMILSFIFYFIGGYLLYASLFASIGAAVDDETDTQQFMLPVTIPLILSIIVAQFVIQNPDSSMAFWFSIIPFTSPIVMMVRIPFGVPYIEIILSVSLLIVSFLATTWMAAKIYRTGILMYGKKASYKELWKWIRY